MVPARSPSCCTSSARSGTAPSRSLSPPAPAGPSGRSRPDVIHRYLDSKWQLPPDEQTFEDWITIWWDDDVRISQAHYDEVEQLYGALVAAQGKEHEAKLAYDVAFYAWNAYYLGTDSDPLERAVTEAAATFDDQAPPTEAEVRATWPGRVPEDVPDDFVDAVTSLAAQRAADKLRAQTDAAERLRQEQAAAAQAIKDRQTRRPWTAREVIRMCGYGGNTSVHPYWGGRVLMINQRPGYHFTLFQDCYTPTQAFAEKTDIQTVINGIFGGNGGQSCLHVTQEMFGQKDGRNPRYFFSGTHKAADPGPTKVAELKQPKLKSMLDEELKRIATLLRVDQNM